MNIIRAKELGKLFSVWGNASRPYEMLSGIERSTGKEFLESDMPLDLFVNEHAREIVDGALYGKFSSAGFETVLQYFGFDQEHLEGFRKDIVDEKREDVPYVSNVRRELCDRLAWSDKLKLLKAVEYNDLTFSVIIKYEKNENFLMSLLNCEEFPVEIEYQTLIGSGNDAELRREVTPTLAVQEMAKRDLNDLATETLLAKCEKVVDYISENNIDEHYEFDLFMKKLKGKVA